MSAIFHKEERSTLMNQALIQIQNAIKSGQLKPGERIVEAALAKEMQISRFPIREALRQLEKDGLVETVPFKGTTVAQFNEKDLEDLYSVREALEKLAIQTLIQNLDDIKLKRLGVVIEAMQKAIQDKNAQKLVEGDLRFHQMLCELSGNRKLLQAWKTIEGQLRIFIALEEFQYNTFDQFLKGHQAVMKAIKKKDTDQAQKILSTHLKEGLEIIRDGYFKA
jgi:DNA-binding GntR family transcriptional regulator